MIKAIETRYAGCRFRSRLEARWAKFFDTAGVKWEYEPEGFEMPSGRYLPDFWLPDVGVWVEVKPGEHAAPPHPRVYFAGKMGDWRNDDALRGFTQTNPGGGRLNHGELDGPSVVRASYDAIETSQAVFVWIDSLTAFGTLVEVGFARGRGVKCFVALDKAVSHQSELRGHECYDDHCGLDAKAEFGELWFAATTATYGGVFGSLGEAVKAFKTCCFRDLLADHSDEDKAKEFSAHNGGDPIAIFRNPPIHWAEPVCFRGGHEDFLGLGRKLNVSDSALEAARSARFGVGGRG